MERGMTTKRFSTLRKVPPAVVVLGFVSMFMDISSEMVHSLLPMFLVSTLGASVTAVGLIEGLAEAASPIVKVFSGTLSDYLGTRTWLAEVRLETHWWPTLRRRNIGAQPSDCGSPLIR
jgi:MFS family permease